jgi:hypothetical protein
MRGFLSYILRSESGQGKFFDGKLQVAGGFFND